MKNLGKKFIAVILVLLISISNLPISMRVFAAEIIKVGDDANASMDINGTVTCTGSGELFDYEYNSSPWYNNTSVSKVVIGSGITRIGNCTFSGCTNLTEVTLPSSLKSMGTHVFYNNTSLKKIAIPEGITNITNNVFFGCTNLSFVSLPDTLTNIGSGTFWECTSLTTLSIPANVEAIGNCAYYGCTGLTNITIPTTVKRVEIEAFKACSNLKKVTIAGKNTSVDYGAFSECSPNLVIVGYSGSDAETYARNNGITFEIIDENTSKNNIEKIGENLYKTADGWILQFSDVENKVRITAFRYL